MATAALGQYFRSFMVKLNMIESQLAELPRDGAWSRWLGNTIRADFSRGENTFAIVLELQEGKTPSTTPDKVFSLVLGWEDNLCGAQI